MISSKISSSGSPVMSFLELCNDGFASYSNKSNGYTDGHRVVCNCEYDENGCQFLIKFKFLANTSVHRRETSYTSWAFYPRRTASDLDAHCSCQACKRPVTAAYCWEKESMFEWIFAGQFGDCEKNPFRAFFLFTLKEPMGMREMLSVGCYGNVSSVVFSLLLYFL